MLTSIRFSDKTKVIGSKIEKATNEQYFCEYCSKEVIHHKSSSRIKIGHFKHKPGHSFCPNIPETPEHLATKIGIYNYIKQGWYKGLKMIELEKWICNNSIRPDIYIETKKGNKIAIEVQASVLEVSEIKRRTEKYFREKIYVLWILVYDNQRFLDYRRKWGYDENSEWKLLPPSFDIADRIKLKEFEVFIYWCYFKKMFLWDFRNIHSKSFIVVELDEYIGESSEFYQEGEYQYFEGKRAKTLKKLKRIRLNIEFDEFKANYGKKFKSFSRNYVIPERYILTYESKN